MHLRALIKRSATGHKRESTPASARSNARFSDSTIRCKRVPLRYATSAVTEPVSTAVRKSARRLRISVSRIAVSTCVTWAAISSRGRQPCAFFQCVRRLSGQSSHRGWRFQLRYRLSGVVLRELAPVACRNGGGNLAFRLQHQRIDPRAQAWSRCFGTAWKMERSNHWKPRVYTLTWYAAAQALAQHMRLWRRMREDGWPIGSKFCWPVIFRGAGLSRRSQPQIGGLAGVPDPTFQKAEGIPLYRYHLRLRLARALDLIAQFDICQRWLPNWDFPATATSAQRSRRTSATERRRSSGSPAARRMAKDFDSARSPAMVFLRHNIDAGLSMETDHERENLRSLRLP